MNSLSRELKKTNGLKVTRALQARNKMRNEKKGKKNCLNALSMNSCLIVVLRSSCHLILYFSTLIALNVGATNFTKGKSIIF